MKLKPLRCQLSYNIKFQDISTMWTYINVMCAYSAQQVHIYRYRFSHPQCILHWNACALCRRAFALFIPAIRRPKYNLYKSFNTTHEYCINMCAAFCLEIPSSNKRKSRRECYWCEFTKSYLTVSDASRWVYFLCECAVHENECYFCTKNKILLVCLQECALSS